MALINFDLKPVIGVVHLLPLPGSPYYHGDFEKVVKRALNDAKKLEKAGVDAIIVENYGDKPYPIRVRDPLTIAAMSVIVKRIVDEVEIPVGVNLLRNSGPEALAIAYATGATFIRVNSYCETRLAPEGILEPVMREIELLRSRLTQHILVLADIDVKHSLPLTSSSIAHVAAECVERGYPDALIVTGSRTGSPPTPGEVATVKRVIGNLPLLVGSGITVENVDAYWNIADGFIVGTYFKRGGVTTAEVDPSRVKTFMEKIQRLRSKQPK